MAVRIKKTERGEFVRVFSNCNQFRPVEIKGSGVLQDRTETSPLYLLGMRYSRTASDDALEVYATKVDEPSIGFQVASIRPLKTISLTQEPETKNVKLSAVGADGKEIELSIRGDLSHDVRKAVTAKIAYALFQRDGAVNGRDFEHWGEAEKIVRDLEQMVEDRFL